MSEPTDRPTPDPTTRRPITSEAQPLDHPVAPQPAADAATSTWRSRMSGARGVAVVAIAALVLGGAGGAALGYSAGDDSGGGFGGPGGMGQMRGGFPGAPGQQQGQQGGRGQGQTPPSTAPRDDVQPDGADAPSSTT